MIELNCWGISIAMISICYLVSPGQRGQERPMSYAAINPAPRYLSLNYSETRIGAWLPQVWLRPFWMNRATMVLVGRHINGITINPLEFILDDNGEVMGFENEEAARVFLKKQVFTDEDMDWLVFVTEYDRMDR